MNDITPLAGLEKLRLLYLHNNPVVEHYTKNEIMKMLPEGVEVSY